MQNSSLSQNNLDPSLEGDRGFRPLGTDNWKSYALFRAGVYWRSESVPDKARKLFASALREDPKNRGAMLNLGVILVEDREYSTAVSHLRAALAAAKEGTEGNEQRDPVWYKALYQLVSAYDYIHRELEEAHAVLHPTKPSVGESPASPMSKQDYERRKQAVQTIKELSRALKLLNRTTDELLSDAIRCSEELLSTIKLSLDALQAREINRAGPPGIRLLGQPKGPWETLVERTQKRQGNEDRKEVERLLELEEQELKEFLKGIQPVVTIMYAGVLSLAKEYDKAQEVVGTLTDKDKELFRVRYNLACYYSTLAQRVQTARQDNYDLALEHLEFALERGRKPLATWACKDPTLASVRDDPYSRTRFSDMVKKYGGSDCLVVETPKESALPLAKISGISDTYARKLKSLNVTTPAEFRVLTSRREELAQLSMTLGVSSDEIERWRGLAGLLLVAGGDPRNVDLLHSAGVDTPGALRMADLKTLSEDLERENKGGTFVDAVPTQEKLREWQQKAYDLLSTGQ
jgi:tetratricopeptide (TPR) repeat protein